MRYQETIDLYTKKTLYTEIDTYITEIIELADKEFKTAFMNMLKQLKKSISKRRSKRKNSCDDEYNIYILKISLSRY